MSRVLSRPAGGLLLMQAPPEDLLPVEGEKLVVFEDEKSEHRGETTCLGKQTNEHQQAYIALLDQQHL